MSHAKLSPSDSPRWLNCHGAIDLCDSLPKIPEGEEEPENFHAAEGTKAHAIAEQCLNDPELKADSLTDDLDMVSHVTRYVNFVRELAVGGELLVEQRVDMGWVVEGVYGTSDAIIYDAPNKHITVIDLKYGQGVAVIAEGNTQLMLYALGALDNIPFIVKTVELIVFQPRARDGLPAARVHTVTVAELHAFADTVRHAATSQGKDGGLNPGEKQCRWCEAAPVCPALRKYVFETAAAEFEPFKVKEMDDYETNKELGEALERVNLIKQWCNRVEARAQELLEHGHSVPGFKLVRGRSIRRWVNEDKVIESLADKIDYSKMFTKKLISPTQFSKLVSREDYKKFAEANVYVPDGKLTVAKADDKRIAVDPFANFKEK